MEGEKILVILEVSQKQAYIFSSKKLKDNVANSGIIAWVTSSGFFEETAPEYYSEKENLVYSGGGHTILQFDDESSAGAFIGKITKEVLESYPGLELFAKQHRTKGEPSVADMKALVGELEVKKSLRRASFHTGTFGVEKIDSTTGQAVRAGYKAKGIPQSEEEKDRSLYPAGVHRAFEFKNLGISAGDKSYIAVVHIDGNAMGKRIEELRAGMGSADWETVRRTQRAFSDTIDKDFTDAYREMCAEIHGWMKLKGSSYGKLSEESRKGGYFPVRRIISAGDDICFVTEGRIGLECAALFLRKLSAKTNKIDGRKYAACAGVALVHQKYPFYRAYELAETLCSSAKKYVASATAAGENASAEVSAIDWHIEQGEIKETLDDIRRDYLAMDGSHMEMRPYIVEPGSQRFVKEKTYDYFKNTVKEISGSEAYARGKYKGLRSVIKKGRQETENYQVSKLFDDRDIYLDLMYKDRMESHSIIFDAVEIMDVFLPVESKEGK